MKIYFIILPFLFAQIAFAQTDTISVNGNKFFTTTHIEKNEYGQTDTLLKIFRMENGRPKYVLSHYSYLHGFDCNNEYWDIGTIEVKEDKLIFHSRYIQKGFDPIPTSRKQIYQVNKYGRLILLSDKSYFAKK
jgi:hypothetical protein